MIIHPSLDRQRLTVVGDSRLLEETFGLINRKLKDDVEPGRIWTIRGFYAPIRNRLIGGIRAKVTDDRGFVSFVNQRDLEVLLNIAEPGEYCRWLGKDYTSPYARDWFGFCMDAEDLHDDLFDRELELRMHQGDLTGSLGLPIGFQLTRRLHLDPKIDVEELLYLEQDHNPERVDPRSGYYVTPDLDFDRVGLRWRSIERRRTPWRTT